MARKKAAAKPKPVAIYDLLTRAQKQVVDHGHGPLLAGAVAGAGKSTTLIERVAKLVANGVPLGRICLVAFNVAAAADLNKKLKKRLKDVDVGDDKVDVARTLHSLALAIFKSDTANQQTFLDHTGSLWPKAIQGAFDQLSLTKEERDVELLKKFTSKVRNDYIPCDPMLLRLGHVPTDLLAAAHVTIQSRKLARITDPKLLVNAFATANQLRQAGDVKGADGRPFVTFDDILWEAVRAFDRDEALLARWQARYDHIIVDEAQDLCETQWLLVEHLSRKHRCVVVVGDPAQALYRFRGARPERLLSFADRWGGARVYMQENFRSGSDILDCANRALDAMPEETKLPMHLAPTRGTTGSVKLMQSTDSRAEADAIARACVALVKEGREWRDAAILVRMNDQTMDLELQCFLQRVPVRMVSGASFFSLHETKVMLAYLRIIHGHADRDDLLLSVTNPSRYLGRKFVDEVAAACGDGDGDWIDKVAQSRAGGQRGEQFVAQMREWRRAMLRGSTPLQLVNEILERTDFARWQAQEKADDDVASNLSTNLNRVRDFCGDFNTVEELLRTVEEVQAAQRAAAASRNAVTISTVHQAKGLEWPVVFIPGVTADRWPVPWGEEADELRCWYVALTRARDECWVSTYSQTSDLAQDEVKASKFLAMIQPSLAPPPASPPVPATQLALGDAP